MSEFHVIIPARFGSERFPGKVLAELEGRPMIVHVLDVARASGAKSVVVATDDRRVRDAVRAAGGDAIMTGEQASGTDRVAAAARRLELPDAALLVNLQGDEPLMPPLAVRQVAECLAGHAAADMGSLCTPIREAAELCDPNVVKVVLDRDGLALYFSRAPIPWERDAAGGGEGLPASAEALRHVGIYAYRNAFLQELTRSPPAPLERAEKLEQLRALHLGHRIAVSRHPDPLPAGVDTPEDLARAAAALRARGKRLRVLFVCMGNICRSPTAQGVGERLLRERGLAQRFELDSAGTHAYHVGEPPDPRARQAAKRRGVDLDAQRARQVTEQDFHRFDYVLAMDAQNLEALLALRPPGSRAAVRRVLDYSDLGVAEDVPDPYYGGAHGFEQVLDLLENAVDRFLQQVVQGP